MDCVRFQELIHDFIFDKIKYSGELKEFIHHFNTCESCKEELKLYYMIYRGLGEINSPFVETENSDSIEELESIIHFYEEYFNRRDRFKKAGKALALTLSVILLCGVACACFLSAGII